MAGVVGIWLAGSIEKHQGTYLATRMAHINFLSIFPQYSVLVVERGSEGRLAYSLPIDWRSAFAAYGRGWPIVGVIAGLALGATGQPLGYALAVLAVAILVAAHRIGRITAAQGEQRALYASVLGYPVDPLHVGRARNDIRQGVFEELVARAKKLDPSTYRVGHDPRTEWGEFALDPMMRTSLFNEAVLDASARSAKSNPWIRSKDSRIRSQS